MEPEVAIVLLLYGIIHKSLIHQKIGANGWDLLCMEESSLLKGNEREQDLYLYCISTSGTFFCNLHIPSRHMGRD